MPIDYTSYVEADTLFVTANAVRFTTDEVKAYGLGVITACLEHGCTKVLCDETGMATLLNTLGSYEAAEFVAAQAPAIAKVAIVCAPHHLEGRQFWETVAVNRGLQVRVFPALQAAKDWLLEAPALATQDY